MKRLIQTTLFLFALTTMVFAQNTVGLLSYEPDLSEDGINLFYPHNQPDVLLMNNCGELVHRWEGQWDRRPANTAYLLENGNLVKSSRNFNGQQSPIWAGGGGERVEIVTWDNEVLWSFEQNDSLARLHHDIEPMPNGNILMISWELRTEGESIQAGRDPSKLPQAKLWPDYILEVDPTSNEVVWEWHAWDHLIQDFDASKDNFGVVANHPELIDINYDSSDGHPDWMHSNSIDYNPSMDQIMISVPTFSEIWIIDHSTTTEEAAGHSGGNSSMGGDLLFRWGNPVTYRAGTEEDQQLFYQHDAHWIETETSPFFGKLAVFNNRVATDSSTINIIEPEIGFNPYLYIADGGRFLPETFSLTASHPESAALMASSGLSGWQLLDNGNYLICAGRPGYFFEMTPNQEIVWEYLNPLNGGQPVDQGTDPSNNNNLVFRVNRLPLDHPAFEGRDLAPIGYLEANPDTNFCNQILPVEELVQIEDLKLFPNPAQDIFFLSWTDGQLLDVEIFDALGQRVYHTRQQPSPIQVEVGDWPSGIYFTRLAGQVVTRLIVD